MSKRPTKRDKHMTTSPDDALAALDRAIARYNAGPPAEWGPVLSVADLANRLGVQAGGALHRSLTMAHKTGAIRMGRYRVDGGRAKTWVCAADAAAWLVDQTHARNRGKE